MRNHRAQLTRCQNWLELAERAEKLAAGYLYDATFTIWAASFPNLKQVAMDKAKRCETVKNYCLTRYKASVRVLAEMPC